jgi:hypothetical protein
MKLLPIFLSVVLVVRNQSDDLDQLLSETGATIASLVSDYELIIVDNSSTDESVFTLKKISGEAGIPNLQIYALTKEVDSDTASWVGLENALGDFIAVVDPSTDDIKVLAKMLDEAVSGADVVFASNEIKLPQSISYRMASAFFDIVYLAINGISLTKEAPQYRILSKRVVNFILQHPQPAITYRHIPVTGGFARVNLSYSAMPRVKRIKRLSQSIDRGMRLLVSTTRAPMRLVTGLSLFGALSNLLYSLYVVAIVLTKPDVAPGWASLALQQSGMFFLISLVLLVLGEYILNMARQSNEGPLYYVGQEFTSSRMTRHEKLNVEEVLENTAKYHINSTEGSL